MPGSACAPSPTSSRPTRRPGGGSVAAFCGAMSAALTSMVANLTVGRKGYEKAQKEVKALAVRAQKHKDDLLRAVDLDAAAFNKVMDALKLPRANDEQKAERDKALETATQEATLVPFQVLESSIVLVKLAKKVALKGNKNSLSDAGVAALAAQTAGEGAYYNVRINLPGIQDAEFKARIKKQAVALKKKLCALADEVRAIVERELRKG